jgi:glutamate carboxypeptidase
VSPGRAAAEVDRLAEGLPALLGRWCAINSGSRNLEGLAAMLAALREVAAPLAESVDEVPVAPGGPAVLDLVRRPGAEVRVLLMGHYDTVFGPEDPFRRGAPAGEDRFVGPGAADMKGGLLVLLTALAALEAAGPTGRLGWRVLVTPDEEVGSQGSAPLIAAAAAEAHVGLVFEPASGADPVRSRRGRDVLAVAVRGRAAHAGRDPGAGRSAVAALAELIGRLEALHDPARGVSLNVGRIAGGGAVNVVPDAAAAELETRSGTAADAADVRARIAATAREVAARREVAIDVRTLVACPPMPREPRRDALLEAYRERARALGVEVGAADLGGVSDGNLLAAAGLPVLDGLGVVGGGLHGPEEWVRLSSLAERARIAAELLTALDDGRLTPP